MIEFFVPGLAKPNGSKRAFPMKNGRIAIVDDSGKAGKNWRADVKSFGMRVYSGPPLEGPLAMILTFYLPRPKAHFGTGKNAGKLKESAPDWPKGKPDTLKLARAVEDALEGIIYKNDSQIVDQIHSKRYGANPGVHVLIGDARGRPGGRK